MFGQVAGDLGSQLRQAGRVEAVPVEGLPGVAGVDAGQMPQVTGGGEGQVDGLAVFGDAAQQHGRDAAACRAGGPRRAARDVGARALAAGQHAGLDELVETGDDRAS